REWPAMLERSRRRPVLGRLDELLGRTWQLLSSHDRNDPTLVADLEAALAGEPRSAALHNALGLAVTLMQPRQEGLTPATAQQAAAHFRRAWECDPSFLVAGLNLAEALACTPQRPEAVEQVRRALTLLDRQPSLDALALDAGHFPPVFDHFRVEWDRAAWAHAGDPPAEALAKRNLLRWRLHLLLAELTGDLAHA